MLDKRKKNHKMSLVCGEMRLETTMLERSMGMIVKIIKADREDCWLQRGIREPIYIRIEQPFVNRRGRI